MNGTLHLLFLFQKKKKKKKKKKKSDLSNCNNNYKGISLINVGLKILTKIITDRISKNDFEHNFIRPEPFGFFTIMKNALVSTFPLEKYVKRRKLKGQFT